MKQIIIEEPKDTIDVAKANIRKGILVLDTPGNIVGQVIELNNNNFGIRFSHSGFTNYIAHDLKSLIKSATGYKFIQYE